MDDSQSAIGGTGAGTGTGTAPAEAVFDVFLSYNRKDKDAVKEIARILSENELNVWLDEWNLVPGEAWQTNIEKILRKCRSVAVVIGPSGLSPWQQEEMRAAVVRRVSDTRGLVRVIPVLLPGIDRGSLDDTPFLSATTWVEFSDKFSEVVHDKEAIHRLVCGIRGLKPGRWENAAPNTPTRYYFIVDGTIDEIDHTKVQMLIEKLRQYSGDASLMLKEIARGSVVLVIDGSAIGFERLDFLFRTGQLSDPLGREIELEVRKVMLAEETPAVAEAGAAG